MKFTIVALLLFDSVFISSPAHSDDATKNIVHGIGFGSSTVGGNFGNIYTVLNLNDSGPGSLRQAVLNSKRPAFIQFMKCGTIELKSRLFIENGNLTVDGSSCEGGAGIQIKNYPVTLRHTNNVILSNLAFRLGTDAPVSKGTAQSSDSLEVECSQDIVLDHLSIYWGTDENLSFYCYPENKGEPTTRISVQYSIIAEALRQPKVLSGEGNSKGVLIDGAVNDITFYRNLFVSNCDRNPEIGPSSLTPDGDGKTRVQLINNMQYHNVYGIRSGRSSFPNVSVEIDIIGNLQKQSPDNFLSKTQAKPLFLHRVDSLQHVTVYIHNNRTIHGDTLESPNPSALQTSPWMHNLESAPNSGVVENTNLSFSRNPLIGLSGIEVLPASSLESYIVNTVGKILPCRDPIDQRVIKNVANSVPANQGGQRPVDEPMDVGGYMTNNWKCGIPFIN